jgi:uncharacterized protein (UPF0303 family)
VARFAQNGVKKSSDHSVFVAFLCDHLGGKCDFAGKVHRTVDMAQTGP